MSPVYKYIERLSVTPETAISTLNAVLRPSACPSVDQSIWSMLRRFRLYMLDIQLAERLVTALCMSIRRGDMVVHEQPLLIDSYFAEMGPSDVVTALAMCFWDARRNTFRPSGDELRAVHLVQHCIELRTEWWNAILDYAQHSASEHERRMLLALEGELARRGPCVTCPEPPNVFDT